MDFDMLDSVLNYLQPLALLHQADQYIQIPLRKNVAITCMYLGCSWPTLQ